MSRNAPRRHRTLVVPRSHRDIAPSQRRRVKAKAEEKEKEKERKREINTKERTAAKDQAEKGQEKIRPMIQIGEKVKDKTVDKEQIRGKGKEKRILPAKVRALELTNSKIIRFTLTLLR